MGAMGSIPSHSLVAPKVTSKGVINQKAFGSSGQNAFESYCFKAQCLNHVLYCSGSALVRERTAFCCAKTE